MTTDQKMNANELQQGIEAVSDMIVAARKLLAAGEQIDLTSIENEIDTLCQAIHADPPKNSRDIRRGLAAIVDDLDALEHELNDQHRQLEQNLAERTRKLALEAYSDPANKDSENKT
jgi:hypothetical protein